jgi:hypothetical protein
MGMWPDRGTLGHAMFVCAAIAVLVYTRPISASGLERALTSLTMGQLLGYVRCSAELSEGMECDLSPLLSP